MNRKTLLILLLGILGAGPAGACVSNVAFSVVTATSATLAWSDDCPNGTSMDITLSKSDPADTAPPVRYTDIPTSDQNRTVHWYSSVQGLQPNSKMQFDLYRWPSLELLASVSTNTFALVPAPRESPLPAYSAVAWDRMTVRWTRGAWVIVPNSNAFFVNNPSDTRFQLQLSLTPDFSAPIVDQTEPVIEMTPTCLDPQTLYYARVRAIDRLNRPTEWTSLGSTRTLVMGGAPASSYAWDNGRWTADFPTGFLSQRDTVKISATPKTSPVRSASVPAAIQKANDKLLARGDARQSPLYLSEIRLERGCPAQWAGDLSQPVEIAVEFALSNGQVTTPAGPLRPDTLSLYRLDETDGLWVRVPNSQRTGETQLSATVQELGVFGVFGSPDDSLKDVFAYPTPYSRAQGGPGITFVNISENATLTLYTAAGTPVRTLEETNGDGRLTWDTQNTAGEPVAPGVYFYLLESPSEKRKGRVMISP